MTKEFFDKLASKDSVLPLFDYLRENGFDSPDCSFKFTETELIGNFAFKYLNRFLKIFKEYDCKIEKSTIYGFRKVTVKLLN